MNTTEILYLVFGIVVLLALAFDLGLISKKDQTISIKKALWQTLFWVLLALSFFVFLLLEDGSKPALEYISAYLMEWSLSIDNIFVFILIFSAFKIRERFHSRVLLLGILMAILFRVIFIIIGVELIERFHWILYVFGVFLIYTGIKIFAEDEEKEFEPHQNKMYRFLKKFLPLTHEDGNGKYIIRINGKPQYTILFVVVVLLASIDLIFALDSIPAVMGISQDRLVIFTSNIFAVLGLRSLFFLLKGAVKQFQFLQQGISIVLIFIGAKMLAEYLINQWLSKNEQVFISLAMIVLCIGGSIVYSVYYNKKNAYHK
jgi:tellurite resistance protein TerC